jgi:apolipoprotein N-acyltransferase
MSWEPTQTPEDYRPRGPAARTNGLAIAALVLGVVGAFTASFVLPSILALVFGLVSLSQIKRSAGTQGGQGLAIAGIVLGAVGVALGLIWLLLFVSFGGVHLLPGG